YDAKSPVPISRAEAVGISQSGRFLRHFLYQDFNADEEGRQVFDGVIAHVAGAGRGSFNHRFAQPSRDGQPMSSLFYPTDLYPFTDSALKNPNGGRDEGLLDAATASKTLPKIFYTNTSYEYWSRAGSLIHTSPDGKADIEPPENVRIYFLAGLQHFSGPFPPALSELADLRGQQKQNPNPVVFLWRALIADLDDWVRGERMPPPSAYPRIATGTLVALPDLRFPAIPGIHPPATAHRAYAIDFGRSFRSGVITEVPPLVGKPFATLVPQVNQDGNDTGGVQIPELAVPLATYTGWNLRDPGIGAPEERVSFIGSYIPFAKTKADREKAGDPRPSVAERYTGREQYLGRFTEAALQAIHGRFLLPEDLAAAIERGGQEWDEAAK
ncbi:MAG TPA: alpha/beta hydrolase domain-containing protein, partial [Myxococcaceae bacterium]|nr:alpha/beta hydrolase domain-containing protein [Myxococcaceae bacterium]